MNGTRCRYKRQQQQQQQQLNEGEDSDYFSRWLKSRRPTGGAGADQRARRQIFKLAVLAVLFALVVTVAAGTRLQATETDGSRTADGRSPYDYVGRGTNHTPAGYGGRRLLEENEGVDCSSIHLYHTVEDKCTFVTVTSDCTADVKFLNYMDFVYCKLGRATWFAVILLILWWLFCFIGLAVTADDFFCPSLVVISKVMHLSPNIAGVTFLAFGNGSPDVFSAIAALSSGGDPALGLGGLLGAGVFVTTCVAGTISVVKPFKAMERPFIRDVLFYLTLVFWTFTILWRGCMYIYETIGYIVLYGFYVFTVAFAGSFYKRQQTKKKAATAMIDPKLMASLEQQDDDEVAAGAASAERRLSIEVDEAIEMNLLSDEAHHGSQQGSRRGSGNLLADLEARVDAKRREAEMDRVSRGTASRHGDGDDDEYASDGGEPKSPFREFLDAIKPIDVEEFPEMSWYNKIYEIAKAPILFALTLTCPVVDYEDEENHNWCKYLQVLQCVSSPLAAVFLTRVALRYLFGVIPIFAIALVVGVALAVACYCTSTFDKRPVYHDAFGFLGFLMGIIWIYTLANEIVALLKTFGIVFNINDAILGLTLLAWGNSMGDWISDTVMAKQGFARMGFSACFGGPYFNLSLGFGIPMLISQLSSGGGTRYGLSMTGVSLMLIGFLMVSLVFSLAFLVFVLKFEVKRLYGLCLLCIYILFLICSILAACNVILPNFSPSSVG